MRCHQLSCPMRYLSPLQVLFFALRLSAQTGNLPSPKMGSETEPGSPDSLRKHPLSTPADTIYKVDPPDPLGNVTFWVSPRRAGLMNAQSKVIYPPIYRDVQLPILFLIPGLNRGFSFIRKIKIVC